MVDKFSKSFILDFIEHINHDGLIFISTPVHLSFSNQHLSISLIGLH